MPLPPDSGRGTDPSEIDWGEEEDLVSPGEGSKTREAEEQQEADPPALAQLRIRVVDSSGANAGSIPLSIVHEDVVRYREAPLGEWTELPLPSPLRDGLLEAEFRTKGGGGRLVDGLRPGRYWIYHGEKRVIPAPVAANGEEVVVTIERPRIQVIVLAPGGGRMAFERDRSSSLHDWPAVPRVRINSLTGVDAVERSRWSEYKRLGKNPWTQDVDGPGTYRVTVFGGPVSFETREVLVGHGTTKVEVRAGSPPLLGELRVAVSGTPHAEGGCYALRLEREGQSLLLDGNLKVGADLERVYSLPLGTYRVIAQGDYTTGWDTSFNDRYHGRAEGVVTVTGLEEVTLPLSLPLAGYLEPAIEVEGYGGSARLWLEDRGEVVGEVLWFREDLGFAMPWAEWPVGETLRSDGLPTGNFILVTELEDGRQDRRPVTLRSGQVTELAICFE